ncbi:putative transcription factor [Corchorus olitorius]|uniref:Transcription factor n=1 Tax=Corchorus olitorius TaxID=93759 RepID=A0A1R3H6A7_9ROSI|nr:putative transcription factor [Corchorus olitorius]
MHLVMADQGGNNNIVMREYRKGNWTVNETLVLIEAKKMDDERRMKKSGDHGEGRSKPTELRWKWVEDYCWRKGCLRSQNQCNDKWDNLMRDYKKVREYQRRMAENSNNEGPSYWEIEKNERKEKNLPSNMLRQIYERLEEVVEKKGVQNRVVVVASPGGSAPNPANIPYAVTNVYDDALIKCWHSFSGKGSDSDTSEYSDSPAKRRRRSTGGNGEGTSATASANNSNEVGTAISKSASIIAEAIQASDEREERRHRDLVNLHERRLKIEESKTEINKNGIEGLVDAINNLANSILALASHKNQSSAPK